MPWKPYKKICELGYLRRKKEKYCLILPTPMTIKNKTVHQLFEEQAEKIPDNIALF